MAQCYKRKERLSFDSDISSPEGKKICESPRSDPNINTASDEGEDDKVLEELNMTERIAAKFPHSPILHYAYSLLLKENNSANNRLPLGLFALFSRS